MLDHWSEAPTARPSGSPGQRPGFIYSKNPSPEGAAQTRTHRFGLRLNHIRLANIPVYRPTIDPMPQSLACLHVHLVFATKNRARILTDQIRPSLHRYLATVLTNAGCHAHLINSVEDHVHLLFDQNRTTSISQTVEDLKRSSSKWMKTRGPTFVDLHWQLGYGAFAVSESNVAAVRRYIDHQREHHRRVTFESEYRSLLQRHGIAFDERFVWD